MYCDEHNFVLSPVGIVTSTVYNPVTPAPSLNAAPDINSSLAVPFQVLAILVKFSF